MKKLFAVAALVALPFSNAVMADSDIGCGVGTMIFDGKEGKVFKVLGQPLTVLLVTKPSVSLLVH